MECLTSGMCSVSDLLMLRALSDCGTKRKNRKKLIFLSSMFLSKGSIPTDLVYINHTDTLSASIVCTAVANK